MKERKILTALFSMLGAFLLVWAMRLKGQALVITDTMEYVFPEKWVSVDQWRRGIVPLWNPMIACGTPHLANFQSGVFYPPFWLWNVTGLWDWFYFMILIHVAWGVTGFVLWLRERGVPPIPAFLAALSFGLSSQATNLWGFPTHAATLSWVPWVFWALGRTLDQGTLRRMAVLATCLALQWSAGYLQIGFYTTLFAFLWIAWRRSAWKTWFGLAGAWVLAFLLTAVQWLPTMDFLSHSTRTPHLTHVYCVKASEFLTLLWPTWVGYPGESGYQGTLPNSVFMPAYVGWVVMLFVAAGLILIRHVRERFFLVSAVLALFWSAGSHFPPWRWVFEPWVGTLEPAKASFLWSFCACTAAALLFKEGWNTTSRFGNRRIWAVILGLILLSDMYTVPFRCIRHQPDPFRDPEVISAMRQQARMAGEGRAASLRKRDGVSWSGRPGQAGFLWESAFQGFPNMNSVFGVRAAGAHLSLNLDGYQNMLLYIQKGFPYEGRILDAASVRAVILPERLPGIKFQVGMTQGGMIYHSNAGALPNAWRASWVRELKDRPSVMTEMTRPDIFLEETVLTEDDPDGKAVMLPASKRELHVGGAPPSTFMYRLRRFLRGEAPSRSFTDRDPSPGQAHFEADFSERGWMVLSESFAPGWRAWVDGKPKPLFRANGLFMAVPVGEKGLHRILFRYEPASFRLGLFLSLATLAAFLGLGGFRRKGLR